MDFLTQVSIYLFIVGSAFYEIETRCNNGEDERLDRFNNEVVRVLSMLGDPNGRYPVNETEFAIFCNSGKETFQWVEFFTNGCLNGLQFASLAASDMKFIIKKYCDSPELSKLYISWGRCGNAALNQTVKCWDKLVLDIERVNVEKSRIEDNDKIALMCCDYYLFDRCVNKSYESVGLKECPTASSEGLHGILSGVTGRAVSFLCGKYQPDNDKCDSLLKKHMYLSDIKLNEPLRESPISAMVQIIDSTRDISKLLKQ